MIQVSNEYAKLYGQPEEKVFSTMMQYTKSLHKKQKKLTQILEKIILFSFYNAIK
jgi:anaerobic ribonucleoside-triphosphate reductase